MKKLPFRRKDSERAHNDDDMTISSAFSMGGNSVSDRIMGRMRKNLLSTRNAGSSSSSVSGESVGGPYRRGKGSKGTMPRRSLSSKSKFGTMPSPAGMVSRGSFRNHRNPSRSLSPVRPRSALSPDSKGEGFDGIESEMSQHETSVLLKKKRSPSAPVLRPDEMKEGRFRAPSFRSIKNQAGVGRATAENDEPVEYSLAELRSMSEPELKGTMLNAGVTLEEITQALNEAVEGDSGVAAVADDQRKNTLVALFINSGHVKLVRHDSKNADSKNRRNTIKTSNRAISDLGASGASLDAFDTMSFKSTTSSKSGKPKKSKLDKIVELQAENSQVKRENKSLKKTVKKLLNQLLEAEKKEALAAKRREKEENEENELKEMEENGVEKGTPKEDDGERTINQDEKKLGNSSEKESDNADLSAPQSKDEPTDSSTVLDDLHSKDDLLQISSADANDDPDKLTDECASIVTADTKTKTKHRRRNSDASVSTLESQLTGKNKNISYLKQKLKKEREAHENTATRLKAEIEIMTTEVSGLQRELAHSLESLDDAERRAREARELASNLKHKLRNASTKVSELKEEADARDKLIDTFTRILLQRVGVEGDGVNGADAEGGMLGEEKIGESLSLLQSEKLSSIPFDGKA